jgi:hypothetical protein
MLHKSSPYRKFRFRFRAQSCRGNATITARTRDAALTILARLHPGASLVTRD